MVPPRGDADKHFNPHHGPATPPNAPTDLDMTLDESNAMPPTDTPEAPETEAAPPLPTGPVRATIAKGYRIRLLILTLGLCGFACWALYDGAIGYPKKQAMYEDLEAFQAEHDDWQTRWADHARTKGYGEDIAKTPTKLKPLETHDIATQFVMMGICAPIGLWFGWCWLAAGRRYVEADDNGVRTNAGVDLTWDQVTAIEDDRWKSKGIAYLKHGDDQRVLLDDWKFNREETTMIYRIAESKVSPAKPAASE
ncbi:MAG: hypothetical protein AAGF84_09315 [Planctomycetota bacterium]